MHIHLSRRPRRPLLQQLLCPLDFGACHLFLSLRLINIHEGPFFSLLPRPPRFFFFKPKLSRFGPPPSQLVRRRPTRPGPRRHPVFARAWSNISASVASSRYSNPHLQIYITSLQFIGVRRSSSVFLYYCLFRSSISPRPFTKL